MRNSRPEGLGQVEARQRGSARQAAGLGALVVVGSFALVAACNSSSNPPAGATSSGASGGSSGSSTSSSGSSSGNNRDASSSSSGGDASSARDVEVGPYEDAPFRDGNQPLSDGDACKFGPLAWWATQTRFDSAVVSANFAAQMNPLVAAQHPITVVEDIGDGGAWTLLVTGTKTNGIGQQLFPFDHLPSAAVLNNRTPSSFASATPATSAWMRVLDSASAEIWIPIQNVSTTGAHGNSDCTALATTTVNAVIPRAAGTTALTTANGATTLASLLGGETSTTPAGWNLRMRFEGDKIEVTYK